MSCANIACLNGATCGEEVAGPVCSCTFAWEGRSCGIFSSGAIALTIIGGLVAAGLLILGAVILASKIRNQALEETKLTRYG